MDLSKLKALKAASLPQVDQQAKSSVLKDMRDKAAKSMSEKLGGLKKVAVMSDSPEGLEEGLDKAKQLVEGDEMEDSEESEMLDGESEEQLLSEEDMELSPDQIDQKIAKLIELKEQKKLG